MIESVAAGLLNNGVTAFRQSVTGEPRAPLCGMGVCFECRVEFDGQKHVRSCQVPCGPHGAFPAKPGIVIIGAGPAGIAAARKLRELGREFTVIDDNPTAGGQIWRGDETLTRDLGSHLVTGTRVISLDAKTRRLLVEDSAGAHQISYTKLILATGSRELLLPFPGWTLPGVFGAGGLQALVKSGLNVKGKRVVVAGTGPLLLAVAALLRAKGADVRLIAEQASAKSLTAFGAALLRHPAKLLQGAGLGWTLAGVPYETSTWITRAEGTSHLERVTLRQGNETTTEPCDYAAVGYGLIPNEELNALAGNSPDIITAQTGDADLATLAGIDAACEATGQPSDPASLHAALEFDAALKRAFALRPELRHLAAPDTLVCRCEDVTHSRLTEWTSFRAAKLHTRCGMGPCQGRVCGAAARFLFNWTDTSVRPPAFPARISTLVTTESEL